MKDKNLRTLVVTPDTGKDFRDTQKVTGTAKMTKAWKATNETTQYTTGSASKGALGGKNTNS